MMTDTEMIANPNSWPQWPRLPLKKDANKNPNVAVLWEGGDGVLKLAEGLNMLDHKLYATANWQVVTASQVIARGWRVD